MIRTAAILVLLFLSACAPAGQNISQPGSTSQPAAAAPPMQMPSPALPVPTRSSTQLPAPIGLPSTPIPEETPTGSVPLICSPLEGIPIAELASPDLLKNPFQPPRPGMDDGHHGVDFAYWSRGERKTMLGLPVLSVLSGRVAGIIRNRQPYGNAIIIETPLDGFLLSGLAAGVLPTPSPTIQPAPSLFCPPGKEEAAAAGRSLYLLYAHLNKTPLASIGDAVSCGQPIGEVGTTGKSVNPHLHLETRVGPAGATFPVMAHYENDATTEEMQAYCTWRVSGLFQMFDPMALFELK